MRKKARASQLCGQDCDQVDEIMISSQDCDQEDEIMISSLVSKVNPSHPADPAAPSRLFCSASGPERLGLGTFLKRLGLWGIEAKVEARPTSCQLVSRSPQPPGGYPRAEPFAGGGLLSSLAAESGLQGIGRVRVLGVTSHVRLLCSLPSAFLSQFDPTLAENLAIVTKGTVRQRQAVCGCSCHQRSVRALERTELMLDLP